MVLNRHALHCKTKSIYHFYLKMCDCILYTYVLEWFEVVNCVGRSVHTYNRITVVKHLIYIYIMYETKKKTLIVYLQV